MLSLASVAEPLSVVEFVGSVIEMSLPAFALGGAFINGTTFTLTSSVVTAPWSSVTVSRNT
jgi:hypothetical protein